MKKLVMILSLSLIVPVSNAHSNCGKKPEKTGWVVTVDAEDQYGGCFTQKPQAYVAFDCEANGLSIKKEDEVLGYTDFECLDIGHKPGLIFEWIPVFIPVKIL